MLAPISAMLITSELWRGLADAASERCSARDAVPHSQVHGPWKDNSSSFLASTRDRPAPGQASSSSSNSRSTLHNSPRHASYVTLHGAASRGHMLRVAARCTCNRCSQRSSAKSLTNRACYSYPPCLCFCLGLQSRDALSVVVSKLKQPWRRPRWVKDRQVLDTRDAEFCWMVLLAVHSRTSSLNGNSSKTRHDHDKDCELAQSLVEADICHIPMFLKARRWSEEAGIVSWVGGWHPGVAARNPKNQHLANKHYSATNHNRSKFISNNLSRFTLGSPIRYSSMTSWHSMTGYLPDRSVTKGPTWIKPLKHFVLVTNVIGVLNFFSFKCKQNIL